MEYSTSEIIDIAIGIEQTGYEFYFACAEQFKDQGMREVFTFLADQELCHRKIFENIKNLSSEVSGNFNDDYYLYLKSIGGGRVFNDKISVTEQVKRLQTVMDAVRKGFQDEKESILYYTELRKLYPDNSETVKLLDQIIEEERRHAMTLADLAEKLNN